MTGPDANDRQDRGVTSTPTRARPAVRRARPRAPAAPVTAMAMATATEPRTISRETARRYLAIRHFLTPPRSLPTGRDGILAVFDRLGSIQFDPIEIAGRNHDLVLLARVA